MGYKQISFEDAIVNRIRSGFKTLSNYRRTSMLAHGRSTESVHAYARTLNDFVSMARDDNPDSPEIQRWVGKFDEYVKQHDLLEPRISD